MIKYYFTFLLCLLFLGAYAQTTAIERTISKDRSVEILDLEQGSSANEWFVAGYHDECQAGLLYKVDSTSSYDLRDTIWRAGDYISSVKRLANGDLIIARYGFGDDIGDYNFWITKVDSYNEPAWEQGFDFLEASSHLRSDLALLPDESVLIIVGDQMFRYSSTGDSSVIHFREGVLSGRGYFASESFVAASYNYNFFFTTDSTIYVADTSSMIRHSYRADGMIRNLVSMPDSGVSFFVNNNLVRLDKSFNVLSSTALVSSFLNVSAFTYDSSGYYIAGKAFGMDTVKVIKTSDSLITLDSMYLDIPFATVSQIETSENKLALAGTKRSVFSGGHNNSSGFVKIIEKSFETIQPLRPDAAVVAIRVDSFRPIDNFQQYADYYIMVENSGSTLINNLSVSLSERLPRVINCYDGVEHQNIKNIDLQPGQTKEIYFSNVRTGIDSPSMCAWVSGVNNAIDAILENDHFCGTVTSSEKPEIETNKIEVYPNPARGEVFVEFRNHQPGSASTIKIYNVTGQQMPVSIQFISNENGVDRFRLRSAELKPGIYTIALNSASAPQTALLVISE